MAFIFNGKSVNNMVFEPSNRAMAYGDGLFETMLYVNKYFPLGEFHQHRLQRGLFALGLYQDYSTNMDYWKTKTEELIKTNLWTDFPAFKVKYQVWRKEGGKYAPAQDHADHFLMVEPYTIRSTYNHLVLCERTFVTYSHHSRYKTLNSLPYVIAGREMRDRNASDILILNQNGHISETLYSNIFWIKEGIFYTPPILTGCKEGTMRKYVMKELTKRGDRPKKVYMTPKTLHEADHVFTTCATGINSISSFEQTRYTPYPRLKELWPVS